MVVCVNCGIEVPTLYHVYDETNFCLSTCVHCGKISDKYVEWELPLMIIDLFLFKIEVYRHLIHNHASQPFENKHTPKLIVTSNLAKVVLLLLSATILESYSLLITCNYLSEPCDFCIPEFKRYTRASMDILASYFSPSLQRHREPFEFKFEGVEQSLGREAAEPVSSLVQSMAMTMMFHSRLKILERRGTNDECCKRTYTRGMGLLFLLFLQNPTLVSWTGKWTADCKNVTELGIILLSVFRVFSYCLFIALLAPLARRLGRPRKPPNAGTDCKCKTPELHAFSTSHTNVVFALLLCFQIKALVLMMNIWYPRHTILIIIEFYIYLSHVFELNAICDLSLLTSAALVVSGALLKLAIYFVWFHLQHFYELKYFQIA